jgi:hypothetical protein
MATISLSIRDRYILAFEQMLLDASRDGAVTDGVVTITDSTILGAVERWTVSDLEECEDLRDYEQLRDALFNTVIESMGGE